MYARLSVQSAQHVEIDFDRELPVFPEPSRNLHPRFSEFLVHRSMLTLHRNSLLQFADAMWHRNRGRWSVEISHPAQYLEFGRSLLLVDGLNGITAASRFTLHVKIGRCFDGHEVGTAIARTVHEHFFPTEELAVGSGPGWQRKVIVPADPTRVPPAVPATEPEQGQESETREVAVFRVMEPADRDFGEPLSNRVELLSIVEVTTDDRHDSRGLCAEAWIQAVGLARQEFLREQLNAPDVVVEAQGNRPMIADELTDIPSGFGPIHGYLYDNRCETWLIELGWDDMPDGSLDSEQASGSEPG